MSERPRAASPPIRWVPTLYVAEGLPFVATMTVSVLMYKSLGLSDTKIAAFTSLLAWPWSLKPLWSGFMEAGRKRTLVAVTEALCAAGFAAIAVSLSSSVVVGLSLVLFGIVAFASASHDIAADGLYIESLTPAQQGQYIGYASGFWSVGRILAQGAFVWLAGVLEKSYGPVLAWRVAMGAFALLLAALALYHRQVLPRSAAAAPARRAADVWAACRHSIRTFLVKKHVAWGLAFVVFYRFAEGQAMKILPLFLRADRARGGLGLSTDVVGVAYGTLGAVACIAGAVAGGHFAARRGLSRALLPLCAAFNLPYLCYVALSWIRPSSLAAVGGAIVVEWFGYGFGFVAVTLFMMQQMASGPYKMSHYAIATSAMNLGLIVPGAWSGWLSDWLGYRGFFLWVMASTLVSFAVAWRVPVKSEDELAAEEPAGAAA